MLEKYPYVSSISKEIKYWLIEYINKISVSVLFYPRNRLGELRKNNSL